MKLFAQLAVLLRANRDEDGATAVEYGLMVALIAIVIIGAVTAFGVSVSELFEIPAGVIDGTTP